MVSQHDNVMLGALKVVPPILLEAPLSTVRLTLPESFFWKGRKLGSAVFLAFLRFSLSLS